MSNAAYQFEIGDRVKVMCKCPLCEKSGATGKGGTVMNRRHSFGAARYDIDIDNGVKVDALPESLIEQAEHRNSNV